MLKSSKAYTLGVRLGNMPYSIAGPTFSLQLGHVVLARSWKVRRYEGTRVIVCAPFMSKLQAVFVLDWYVLLNSFIWQQQTQLLWWPFIHSTTITYVIIVTVTQLRTYVTRNRKRHISLLIIIIVKANIRPF